jgi:raffinose/stachyose/melibiose transport system substrate-binding protein
MELMGTWSIAEMRDENPAFARDELDFFAFPAVAGGAGDPRELIGAAGDQYYSVASTCPDPEQAFRLVQGLIDEPAVAARVAEGRIPPVRGLRLSDPLLAKVAAAVEAAPSVQLWYDQYLAPELAETVKDVTQALLGLAITPEDAAAQLEQAARASRARELVAEKAR